MKCEERLCGNAEEIESCRWRSEKSFFLVEEYQEFESLRQRKERIIRGKGFRKLLWVRLQLCW